MPSDKCNSTMDATTGLISSLDNIALSRDVPFCQPKQLQCMHHRLTLALLCVPCLFPLQCRCWFMACARNGFSTVGGWKKGFQFVMLYNGHSRAQTEAESLASLICVNCYAACMIFHNDCISWERCFLYCSSSSSLYSKWNTAEN